MRAFVPAFMMTVILLSALPARTAGEEFYQEDRAGWVDNGLVLGWGSHEPFIFRIRRGGAGPFGAEWDKWLAEHEESEVIAAKKAGIEVYHTHGYKGFGYEAEKDDMKLLEKLSGYVHEHGMKLDTYSQVMTIVPETFWAEVPEAKDWVQRDEYGKPIMLTYGFQQSYRYKPSMVHPGYRKYYKEKILKTLVGDVGTDLLHFDNYDCNAEPESDKSPTAVKAFRRYLRDKYTRERMTERFGHANMDYIQPPLWNNPNRPGNIDVIRDPIQQEWIDFRCWYMTDWLAEMVRYAKGIKPTVAVDVNPHGLYGRNRPFQAALWHPWFMKYTEVIWSEEQNYADVDPNGTLITKIRSYKMARTLDNFMLTYKPDDRCHAENLAFNQTLGNVRLGGPPESVDSKYYEFYRKYRDLYTLTSTREDAAVLRSYATMAYDNHRAALEQCMFEQALIQGQVPFDLVFDEQMDELSPYRVIVLAGQNNLSDENIRAVRDFVESGGGLVLTGETASRDHWGRSRLRPGLADLMGMEGSWTPGEASYSVKKEVARGGRVVYLPEITPPDARQARDWTGSWDGHTGIGTWILPVNWRELADAVRQAAGGRLSVEIEAPDHVVVEQTEKDGTIMVHLVNYKKDSRLTGIPLDVRLDSGRSAASVRLISPDRPGEDTLAFEQSGDRLRMVVPELEVYDVVVIEQR